MDMSAAEIKRASTDGRPHPQPHNPPHSPAKEPNGSQILVRCLQAEGVKYIWG